MSVLDNNAGSVEHALRMRARLCPLIGIGLICLNAVLLGGTADPLTRAACMAGFLLAFGLVLSGGIWRRGMRGLLNDESTRAHRSQSIFVGYCAAIACASGLYAVSAFHPLPTLDALQILLATAVSAPLIAFGTLERRALGDG